jgi:feruloyl-CoA synthase
VRSPALAEFVRERFIAHNRSHSASSTRVERVILLAEPPSLDANEITDKGYVNQRAVLAQRMAEQVRLHGPAAGDDPEVLLFPAR